MKKIILTSVVILSLLNASFLDTVKVQNPISSEKEGSAGQELKNQLDKLNRNLEEVTNKIKTKSEAISKYHKIAKQNKIEFNTIKIAKNNN